MPNILAACDLVVIPSRWFEAFGLVAIEAMAGGKYVIASETGGLADLVRGVGTLYPPGGVAALTKAIEEFLRSPQSYRPSVEKGFGTAEGFSLQRHIERLSAIYRRAMT